MTMRWLAAGLCLLLFVLSGCAEKYPPTSGGRTGAAWAEALKEPNVELRRKAARKLGPLALTDKDALPALLTAMKDDDAKVRAMAAWCLGIYARPQADTVLPPLMAALADRDPGVRCEAIQALEKFGPTAEQAGPALAKLRDRDTNTKVRDLAGKALRTISQK